MSFEHMLVNAEPEDAADGAIIIARALVDDPSASDAARATAAKILELSPEELTRRFRRAKEQEERTDDDPGAARPSKREAESSAS
jgi:hypothetical protein